MTWEEAFARLRGVHDELEAARLAVARTQIAVSSDPTLLNESPHPLRPSHLRDCAANLELTYVVRLFAEFEAILRNYWAATRPRRRNRRTGIEILMNRVATECNMPWDALRNAHAVREYRNAIVHDRRGVGRLTFAECKSKLGIFLSYLPVRW